jgi:hypothetical protein
MVVVEAFRRDFGNGRASISYIKRATRMDDKTIIKTCRELADWGFVLRYVATGKVTEYVPAWATTKPYPTSASGEFPSSENTSGNSTGGTSGDFTVGLVETSPVFSRESYLQSPAYKPADCIGTNEVSETGPGAVPAPAVSGSGFERCWRAYGKYGNKQASRKTFAAIENPDVELIVQRAAAWFASAKPGQRRMPFEKWLAAEKYDEADRSHGVAANTSVKPREPWHDFTIVSGETNECGDAALRVIFHDESDEPQRWPLPPADIDTLLKVCGGEQNAVGARMRFRVRPDESLEFAVLVAATAEPANDNQSKSDAA